MPQNLPKNNIIIVNFLQVIRDPPENTVYVRNFFLNFFKQKFLLQYILSR